MAIFWRTIDRGLLEPQFAADVEEFLANSPYSWYVMEGFRSLERSAKLYDEYVNGVWVKDSAGQLVRGKRGPRAAPPGKSAHNFGLAIDVVPDQDPDKPGLQPTWDLKFRGWAWLKTASIPHPRLSNGWRFNDWPHIERYRWQRFKEWQ